ncbi:MAG: hypothetical protein LBP41_02070 [Holosporaceae bacterium]|jgi:hypothetical protein|nr:hypothetical protein [Holosporaceae bacterium]
MKKAIMLIALLGCAAPFGAVFCVDGQDANSPSDEQKPLPEQQSSSEEQPEDSAK